MPKKDFTLASGLAVTIYKRRSSRNLRLTISPSGQVRVSIPAWAPYITGVEFAKSRAAWILSQQQAPRLLRHGQAIGKAHHLEFVDSPAATKVSSRVKQSLVTVNHPHDLAPNSAEVQAKAEQACVRALRLQAEQLLPQRLAVLAETHGYSYGKVSVKALKSRWGSCDQDKNVVLNLFLMQLPWELIDYVLVHELTHTEVLKHGPDFWTAMRAKLPDATGARKALRDHHPVLVGSMA